MRDDGHKWDPPSADPLLFDGPGLRVEQVWPKRQTLISGARALSMTALRLVEWPGDANPDAFALVLRRDRILEVNGPARQDGWDDAIDCAVSDMTQGYGILHLDGTGALDLLRRGTFVNPDQPSRSVARAMFGLPVMLYRRDAADRFALHIGSAQMPTLRKAIVSHVDAM